MTEIVALTPDSPLWEKIIELAENCSWSAGPSMARRMRENRFTGYECPIAAVVGGQAAGFCALSKTAWLKDRTEEPWTGFVFVSEAFRGRRLSGQMIAKSEELALAAGFSVMHIATGEVGLYEKYGYRVQEIAHSVTDVPQQLMVKEI